MSLQTYYYRLTITNILTVWYSFTVLLSFGVSFVKKLFIIPRSQDVKLTAPNSLFDSKYGVHKYIIANNLKMHYVENGDPSKPLMLFLHGFPEFWYSWRYQLIDLHKDFWCIAVDLRGFGESDRPKDVASYSIDILVEDVRDLIRQLDRESCILVAHDWGGLIACRFRDIYPEVLDALILVGSTSIETWFKTVWSKFEQMKKSWYVFFYRMAYLPERLMMLNNMSKAKLIPDGSVITKDDIDCYKYLLRRQSACTAALNYYRTNFKYQLPVKMKCEKKVPFFVALGSKDEYLDQCLLDTIKEEYAHIETTVIDNCGHYIQQEKPEEVNKLIREFVAKHGL